MENLTRKDLAALPVRQWSEQSSYDSVIIYPSSKKHESGWGCMNIVGCREGKPVEIASGCSDDVSFTGAHKVDCLYKAKAMHFWGSNISFKVGRALSSIEIEVEGK